jgi:hypothetical protein
MLHGKYRDSVYSQSRCICDCGWYSNHIVSSCDILAATLFNNESGFKGILCLAIGVGEQNWDTIDKIPSGKECKLTNEILRIPLKPSSVNYIDDSESVSKTPTNHLRVACTINFESIPGFEKLKIVQLREFGLFGGDAVNQKDTGLLIDYVIHPRIDMIKGTTLKRTIDLIFDNVGVSASVTPAKYFVTGGNGKLVTSPCVQSMV